MKDAKWLFSTHNRLHVCAQLAFADFRPPKTKKMLFKWGGVEGGNAHWGMHLLDKTITFQLVKQRIQPLEVGYANRPQKGAGGDSPI